MTAIMPRHQWLKYFPNAFSASHSSRMQLLINKNVFDNSRHITSFDCRFPKQNIRHFQTHYCTRDGVETTNLSYLILSTVKSSEIEKLCACFQLIFV